MSRYLIVFANTMYISSSLYYLLFTVNSSVAKQRYAIFGQHQMKQQFISHNCLQVTWWYSVGAYVWNYRNTDNFFAIYHHTADNFHEISDFCLLDLTKYRAEFAKITVSPPKILSNTKYHNVYSTTSQLTVQYFPILVVF